MKTICDVAKHGGQLSEEHGAMLVCVLFELYDTPIEDEIEEFHELNAAQQEFGVTFHEVDVAPGADFPALATVVEILNTNWPLLVAAFYLAKPTKDNLSAWLEGAAAVRRFFIRPRVVLGRNAATAVALKAVFDEMGGVPKSITCLNYFWFDNDFDSLNEAEQRCDGILDGPKTEFLGSAVHVFRVEADGLVYKAKVDGKHVHVTREEK